MPAHRVLRLGVLLPAGGALALVLAATMLPGGRTASSSAQAASTAAAAPLPANLPAGEIQSITEHNGARVIVIRAAQPIPVGTSPAEDGMKAFVDPQTGTLREGTAEDYAALDAAASSGQRSQRAVEADVVEVAIGGKGGGYAAQVPDSLTTCTVAHRATDGSVAVDHAQGGTETVRATKAGARAAGKETRHDR